VLYFDYHAVASRLVVINLLRSALDQLHPAPQTKHPATPLPACLSGWSAVSRVVSGSFLTHAKEAVMLVLVEPALAYKDPCLAAVREFHAAGEYDVDAEQLAAQFEDLIRRLDSAKDPATAPPGELPYEDFWLMEGDEWIGKLTLRTTITAQYLHAGGHIGYEIRPSKRRCGYGTALLRLGLEKARERGLQRVLLTCDETNIGSRRVIEANGGQLENAVVVAGQAVKKLRYWIALDGLLVQRCCQENAPDA